VLAAETDDGAIAGVDSPSGGRRPRSACRELTESGGPRRQLSSTVSGQGILQHTPPSARPTATHSRTIARASRPTALVVKHPRGLSRRRVDHGRSRVLKQASARPRASEVGRSGHRQLPCRQKVPSTRPAGLARGHAHLPRPALDDPSGAGRSAGQSNHHRDDLSTGSQGREPFPMFDAILQDRHEGRRPTSEGNHVAAPAASYALVVTSTQSTGWPCRGSVSTVGASFTGPEESSTVSSPTGRAAAKRQRVPAPLRDASRAMNPPTAPGPMIAMVAMGTGNTEVRRQGKSQEYTERFFSQKVTEETRGRIHASETRSLHQVREERQARYRSFAGFAFLV